MAYYIRILSMLLLYTSHIMAGSELKPTSNDHQPDSPRLLAAQILMATHYSPTNQTQLLPLTAAALQPVDQAGRWKYAIEFNPDSVSFIFYEQQTRNATH